MKKYSRAVYALLIVFLLAVTLGCTDGENGKGNGSPSGKNGAGITQQTENGNKNDDKTKNGNNNNQIEVTLFFPDKDGIKLKPVKATVSEKDKYDEAVKALIKGTDDKKLTSIFPKNAKVKKVRVDDGIAVVDFEPGSFDGFVGGSTGEEMLVGSLANTLTEFPEIKKVQILVDGKKIETISGHIDTRAPFERMRDLL